MKVAVPLFNQEVSPRFGCSSHVLLADVESAGVQAERVEDLSHLPPWQWASYLAQQGVTTVICGGIHQRFQEAFATVGIQVIWGVIGPAADALAALRQGTLQPNQFVCPGRHGRRGQGRGGGRGRGRGAGRQPPTSGPVT